MYYTPSLRIREGDGGEFIGFKGTEILMQRICLI
jgi:hypothetical protein